MTEKETLIKHLDCSPYNARVKIAESTTRAGIDVYVNLDDMIDTKRRLDNAEAAARYANRLHFGTSNGAPKKGATQTEKPEPEPQPKPYINERGTVVSPPRPPEVPHVTYDTLRIGDRAIECKCEKCGAKVARWKAQYHILMNGGHILCDKCMDIEEETGGEGDGEI